MELKPGYKYSDVGVIPNDWSVSTIDELIENKTILSHLDGNHGELYPRSNEFKSFGVPYIAANDFANGTVNFDTCKFLSEERAAKFKKGVAKSGDVLFAHNATVGPVALLETNLPYVILSTTATYFRCEPSLLSNSYLHGALQVPFFVKQYQAVMAQSTRFQVPITAQRKLSLVVPPLPEQKEIAKVLSDVDALIAGLEKLIAKKRDIKQAAMQQLLTGQTRLPGFSGEWAVKRLGELANVAKGRGLSKGQIADSGANLCILYGELFTTYERVITSVVSKTNSTEGLLGHRGDVLLPGSTTTKGIDLAVACALLADDVQLGGDINVVRMKSASVYDPIFMANLLTHTQKLAIADLAQGSTIIHLYGRNLLNLMLKLPVITEQTAIATALSDMDTEITALESRLTKTRDLKQGMMQELLTGRTRLV